MNVQRQPTLYIPHGGGPCFFMDPMPGLPPGYWDGMAAYLRGFAASLPERPAALLVVSAHWEAPRPTVGSAARHELLFDYYGFPEHTYRLSYPAAGAPALAHRVMQLLAAAGIASDADDRRGIDHGVFIPLKLAFPDADVPIVPLSLREDLDPHAHYAIGAALAALRDEGVLIVGSGLSYHNLRQLFRPEARADRAAGDFDQWLAGAVAHADPQHRDQALSQWSRRRARSIATRGPNICCRSWWRPGRDRAIRGGALTRRFCWASRSVPCSLAPVPARTPIRATTDY